MNGCRLANIINAEGPALWWELADTSGTTAADSSGNGLTGTYTANAGSVPTLGGDGPEACRPCVGSKAPSFTDAGGTKHYVHRNSSPLSGAGEFTVGVWFRPDAGCYAANQFCNLYDQRDNVQTGPTFDVEGLLQLEIGGNGTYARVLISNGTADVPDEHYTLSAAQKTEECWHFFVVRRDSGGVIDTMFDNIAMGSFTQAHALVGNPIDVGADGFDIRRGISTPLEWERFRGRIAHVQLFTHRVDDAFIADQWRSACRCLIPGWRAGIGLDRFVQGWIVGR